MKYRLSKRQWELIGTKAGWMRTSAVLKIDKTLFTDLQNAMETVWNQYPSAKQTYQNRGMPFAAFAWDTFWKSGFDVNRLYNSGLNDTHIESAFKKIIGEYTPKLHNEDTT